MDQVDLFRDKPLDFSCLLPSDREPRPLYLLTCGDAKSEATGANKSSSVSRKFRLARSLVEGLGAEYLVVSRQDGLFDSDRTVCHHDISLEIDGSVEVTSWADQVLEGIGPVHGARRLVLLGREPYTTILKAANLRLPAPHIMVTPFEGMSALAEKEWLARAQSIAVRLRDLEIFYAAIGTARDSGQTFRLRDLSSVKIPQKGVYVFLDWAERNFLGHHPRIVRIGTHGVSIGSKSTLRARLRNHLGLADGTGSHRGSVFRLHVGRALLQKQGAASLMPSWGRGQDAPRETRLEEVPLERQVSSYLSRLEVFLMDIDDPSSSTSMRALAETQLIALLTDGLDLLDRPSADWLGNASITDSIRRSGLWNVRDVGKPYQSKRPGAVSDLVSRKLLRVNYA